MNPLSQHFELIAPPDNCWQAVFEGELVRCSCVVVDVHTVTPGLQWELDQVTRQSNPDLLLLLIAAPDMHPIVSDFGSHSGKTIALHHATSTLNSRRSRAALIEKIRGAIRTTEGERLNNPFHHIAALLRFGRN